jgi:kinetochore protein Fta7
MEANNGQRALEAEETPAIHSIELLKTEIEREDRRLERRRELLAELEAESANETQPEENRVSCFGNVT